MINITRKVSNKTPNIKKTQKIPKPVRKGNNCNIDAAGFLMIRLRQFWNSIYQNAQRYKEFRTEYRNENGTEGKGELKR